MAFHLLVQHVHRLGVLAAIHGEREIGHVVDARVLDDHVDVDVGFADRTEYLVGDAGAVRHAHDGDLGFVVVERDAGNNGFFHFVVFLIRNQRARAFFLFEGGQHAQFHFVLAGEFDRADLQHLGAEARHLEHFLESDRVQAPRLGHDARVGRIDAVDVGVDLALVGLERGRQRDRRGVGTAASERGDSLGLRIDALKAGDNGNFLAFPEPVDQLGAVDLEDPRGGVGVAGQNRDLPALPGARLNADRLQRDRQQARGDLFAGGHHRVIFARVMHGGGLAAPFHQLVGLAGHRGHHDGDVMAGIDLALHMARDVADAVDIGDGRAAEFHHEAAHDGCCIPLRG